MKRSVFALLAAFALVTPSQAEAFGIFRSCCPPVCAPICVPVCPPRPCYTIECVPVKCTVMVPRYVDVKKTINVCIPVPREIEREICCVKYMPTECVDCHGCTYTCLKPVTYTQRVRCVVYDCRYEPREILCKSVVYDPTVVIRHVYRCVPVACETPGVVMPPSK